MYYVQHRHVYDKAKFIARLHRRKWASKSNFSYVYSILKYIHLQIMAINRLPYSFLPQCAKKNQRRKKRIFLRCVEIFSSLFSRKARAPEKSYVQKIYQIPDCKQTHSTRLYWNHFCSLSSHKYIHNSLMYLHLCVTKKNVHSFRPFLSLPSFFILAFTFFFGCAFFHINFHFLLLHFFSLLFFLCDAFTAFSSLQLHCRCLS